jgi:NAD-dependent dihydropyrimidine dehydrogenase PreA subunit
MKESDFMSGNDAYSVLMERLGHPGSTRLRPILEHLMTPEQAQMVAALPGTSEEVSQRTGFEVHKVRAELNGLFLKGVTFPRDFDKREYFRFARNTLQLHDGTQATQQLDLVRDRKLFELWHDFCINEWYPSWGNTMAELPQPMLRVVPAYKAIKDLRGVLPCEDFRQILAAQELIAVAPCSCRYCTTAIEKHCDRTKEQERWHCLQFARAAEYVIKRGSGKRLTLDEALKLVDEIEDDGLIHTWPNSAALTGVPTSCQCCRDCCMVYVPMDMLNVSIGKAWEKSRYQANVDVDSCNGCQECVERCPFDAIDMIKPKDSKKYKAVISPERCWGCGVCVVACEPGALKLTLLRPVEHIPGATSG